ncbi:hypothetical protein NIES25_56780 (plasmid) [Nostoc linckia NIES-25]|nr:hypothetical protein NIES25_56780 [Nostoc linckia NIES-25]
MLRSLSNPRYLQLELPGDRIEPKAQLFIGTTCWRITKSPPVSTIALVYSFSIFDAGKAQSVLTIKDLCLFQYLTFGSCILAVPKVPQFACMTRQQRVFP